MGQGTRYTPAELRELNPYRARSRFVVRREFVNELGNRIAVTVQAADDFDCNAVSMTIEGPASITENIVTAREADVIFEALLKFRQRSRGV